MKIVVIGGVASGMSFAARARRLAEHAEIVVLERDPYVSFAGCGLPYHLGGEITDRASLILQTPASLADALALDVRTGHEVIFINRDAKTVRVLERGTGREYDEPYDTLMLSTGASPAVPPLPGVDLPQVRVLRNIPDVDRLNEIVASGARRAVVVGAGFIGLEVTEAFRRRGLEVTLVEMTDQVLTPMDPEMAHEVEVELRVNDVDMRTGTSLTAIRPSGDESAGAASAVTVELSDGSTLPADIVLLAVGVRPESGLARVAGLELDERNAVMVNERLLTSDPSIYAAGDMIEVIDAITGTPALVPLAGPANRQGRAAANHLLGRPGRRSPSLGTAIVRVFDTVAATTGRNEKSLKAAGVPYYATHLHASSHAGYYPGSMAVHLKLLFSPDGRVLGAQAVGIDAVDKLIDVIATAIRAGMTVDDLADLELAYAPPFGCAKDPVNMVGFVAGNVVRGDIQLWHADQLEALPEDAILIDVRPAQDYAAGHLPGALSIPQATLRDRLDEVPRDRPVYLYCLSGFRSYLAARVLLQSGWEEAPSLSGGMKTLQRMLPDLELEYSSALQPAVVEEA